MHSLHLNCVLLDTGSGCASPLSIDGVMFGVVTWSTSRFLTVQVRQTVLDRYSMCRGIHTRIGTSACPSMLRHTCMCTAPHCTISDCEEMRQLINCIGVTIGLHHLRRYIGLPHFFLSSNPYTIAHVQYDLTTSWWCFLYDTIEGPISSYFVQYQSRSHSYYDT